MTNTQNQSTTRQHPKRRPSVALVLAFAALFVALSSGAYAASTAQKNSVTSKSIKNGAVKAADLATGSVKTPELKDGSVTSAKIANGSIQAIDLAPGVIPAGNGNGNGGGPALGTVVTVSSDSPATADADGINNGGAHGVATATATCSTGVAIGGGATFIHPILGNEDKNNYLRSSYRTTNGWTASGIVDFGAQGTVKLRTYVYCLVQANN